MTKQINKKEKMAITHYCMARVHAIHGPVYRYGMFKSTDSLDQLSLTQFHYIPFFYIDLLLCKTAKEKLISFAYSIDFALCEISNSGALMYKFMYSSKVSGF